VEILEATPARSRRQILLFVQVHMLFARRPCVHRCGAMIKTFPVTAMLRECPWVQQTDVGETAVSRYYPITSYLRCSNDRAWAMCLDSPIIDSSDPSQAACKSSVLADQGLYIIVNADSDHSNTYCINGVNSRYCRGRAASDELFKDTRYSVKAVSNKSVQTSVKLKRGCR
jgi:hypothetical protein